MHTLACVFTTAYEIIECTNIFHKDRPIYPTQPVVCVYAYLYVHMCTYVSNIVGVYVLYRHCIVQHLTSISMCEQLVPHKARYLLLTPVTS